MNIYIDCEFNSFGGDLISMALVSENGDEWYEVLECKNPDRWVQMNVMPVINKPFIEPLLFKGSLQKWLAQYQTVNIIADWPEDIAHFCRSMIFAPGKQIKTPPLTMEIRRIDSDSRVPHNALHDARALRNAIQVHAMQASAE